MYINRAIIYGNLTRDPEQKALPSGIAVTSFSVATNRTYKDKNGARQEQVDYHNVVAFGKQAELITQYVRKGSPLYIEGRIQTRSWDDKEGKKQYRTEIVLENFQFGPKSSGGQGDQGAQGTPSTPPGKSVPKNAPPSSELDTIEYPDEDINPDDIPF